MFGVRTGGGDFRTRQSSPIAPDHNGWHHNGSSASRNSSAHEPQTTPPPPPAPQTPKPEPPAYPGGKPNSSLSYDTTAAPQNLISNAPG